MRLGLVVVLGLALMIGGLNASVTSVHAATTTTSAPNSGSNGSGVGSACKAGLNDLLSGYFTYVVSSFVGNYTPVTLSQGACASFVSNLLIAQQLDTSAPFVSVCKSIATDYSLDSGFIGPCVSFLSTNKAAIYAFFIP